MIAGDARPRLAKKAMLRVDRKTGNKVLLYPEKGLVLNATGAAILDLCDGERNLTQIIAALAASYTQGPVEGLQREVEGFLTGLGERGLIEGLQDE